MLSPIDETATSAVSAAADKQILATTSSASTIIYTVPENRKFEGHVGTAYAYSGGNYGVVIRSSDGSAEVKIRSGFFAESSQYRFNPHSPITLLAGTIVKSDTTAGPTYILGVESDA